MSLRSSSLILAALLAAACGGAGDGEPSVSNHVSRLRVRVAVADATAPVLSVYDMGDRELVGRLELASPIASVVASQTGETAALVPVGGGSIQLLSAGIAVVPHRGHVHIFKSPPEALGAPVPGEGSVNVTFSAGKWGAFFAGSATARALAMPEATWLQGDRAAKELKETTSHRGYALPFEGGALVTRHEGAAAPDALADAVDRVASDGTVSTAATCPELDGAATDGEHAVFACRDGLVVVTPTGSAPTTIPYAGARIRAISALAGHPRMLGRDETGALWDIDARAARVAPVPVDGQICEATLEIATEARVVALTSDGRVHRIDLATGRASTSAVVGAFDCAAPVRPRLAASADRAWVSSPATGELLEVDTPTGQTVRRVAIGGTPGVVTVLGLDARNADLSTGNDNLSD